MDLYLRVRLACHVDGLSQREAASRFGIARETVKKMLRHSEPPGYRRRQPPRRPKLDPFTDIIDRILEEDRTVHRKQRHTAKRITAHQQGLYLRRLLVIGATSVLKRTRRGQETRPSPYPWAAALLRRKPYRLATVALANKMARIVWAVLTSGQPYRKAAAV